MRISHVAGEPSVIAPKAIEPVAATCPAMPASSSMPPKRWTMM
jgi:hypothetical protein